MMKKLLILIILFSITLGLFAQPNNNFLRTKSYFNSIFSIDEVSKLNSAETSKLQAEKYFNKSNKFYNLAEEYYKKANLPISSGKNFEKKAKKYELKAAENSIKANQIVLNSNKIIKSVYNSNLKRYKTTNKNKDLITELKKVTKKYLDSASASNSKIPNSAVLDKAIFMDDVAFFEQKAFLFMEYQFAVFNNDKPLTTNLTKLYVKKSNSNTHEYNINKDPLLFHSKNEKIDEIISYSNSEEELFKQYYQLGQKGHFFMENAKLFNDTLKKTSEVIAQTSDFMKKRSLVQVKKQILNDQLFQKISSINNYYDANEKYYQLRDNHLYDFMVNDTTSNLYFQIKNYITKKNNFYNDSKRYLKIAKEKGEQEKYDNLMAANDQLLTALYYQENAYNLMFRKDTNFVNIKHKIPTTNKDKNTNSNKTNNKTVNKNTNNKNNQTNKTNNTKIKKTPTVNKINGFFVYSYENPKSKKAYTPDGTIYRIQVGSSKYLLPINELREYDKIYYETRSGTNVKKFLVGDYKDIEIAKTNLTKLKSKGYNDAFIVKYVGGKRNKAIYSSSYKQNINTDNPKFNAIEISKTKYLNYFVQIGTFSVAKTKKELKTTNNLYYRQLSDGRIQYFEGPYYRYSEVNTKLKKVKQNGFTDSYIVAYNNGVKTTITKAKKIEQKVNISTQVIFRVQVGAFSKKLNQEEIDKKFGKIKDIYTLHSHQSKNLIIYSIGDASSFSEAKKIQKTISNLGFSDSFVIAFKGGKQVPLANVIN